MQLLREFLASFHWEWWWFRLLPSVIVCSVRGHDLEDIGYAGPESGCIELVCRRCGYSYPTHTLY